MSTIRVVKNSNYSVINNTVLNNPSLTWESKGLAVYLLSKPDDWRINTNQLWHASANGHGSVKRILRELERAGYLRRTRTRAPNGVFEWDHALYETPQDAADDSATIGRNPSDGNRRMETVAWKPSDILNTEYQLLNKEEGQPRAAALPPVPTDAPTPVVVVAELPEQPEPPATVAAALDGEPLPAAEVVSTSKSLAQQPAVVVYRDTFLAYPSRAQMVQIVQHGVVDLAHWADVTAAWCKSGYNPRNIGGMLDWYDNPERMIASRPQAKTPGSAPRSKVAASMAAVDQVMAMLERQGVTP